MRIIKVETEQGYDEGGELEELTWDLFPVVDARETLHLDQNGLAKIGTEVRPGMILIGKIGKTKCFGPKRQPSALEVHGLRFSQLAEKYGDMWKDTSVYATEETCGIVERAFLEKRGEKVFACVELRVGG